jgi:hypothetical protein
MYRAEDRTCEQSRTFGMRSLPAVACEVSPSAKPSGLQLYASSLKVTVNTSLLL